MNDSWRGFRLLPDDVLFFRDGKPSSQGLDHYLRSIFPPHPFTLYGALRTRRLLDEGVALRGLQKRWSSLPAALRHELGEWLGFGALEVRGPWLVRGDEVLVPAPGDLRVRRKTDAPAGEPVRENAVARLRTRSPAAGGASHGLAGLEPCRWRDERWQPIPLDDQRQWQPAAGRRAEWWLRPAGLAAWRAGSVPEPQDLVHREELWVEEQRTGVGLEDKDRKAADSQIYTFGFIRLLPGVALGFEARHTALRPEGRVRLGGEGRTARLEKGPGLPAAGSGEAPEPGEPCRVAFATPALSEAGAWPSGLRPGRAEGRLGGLPATLRSASVPGYQLVGGWDLARGAPKPLRRAIPAGAVYLLDTEGDAARLDRTCWSDFDDEYLARQGFGLMLVGRD